MYAWASQLESSLQVLGRKFCTHFCSLHACYIFSPSRTHLFKRSNSIWLNTVRLIIDVPNVNLKDRTELTNTAHYAAGSLKISVFKRRVKYAIKTHGQMHV
jgi:hypothetical protein